MPNRKNVAIYMVRELDLTLFAGLRESELLIKFTVRMMLASAEPMKRVPVEPFPV